MQRVAHARRAVGQRFVLRLGKGDQLFDVGRLHRRIRQHQITEALRNIGDRREIAMQIVGELFKHNRIQRKRRRRMQNRIAVGIAFGTQLIGNHAVGACAIVHHHAAAKLGLDLGRHHAPECIGRAARRERH